jgi:hypothetical protein
MSRNTFGDALTKAAGALVEVDLLQPGGNYVINANGSYQIGNLNSAFTKASPPDPNTMPELSMSLEMAHGMWAAKWGWDWVALEALQDTAGLNWGRLADRLQRMSLLENFPDTGAYKLVPKTWT